MAIILVVMLTAFFFMAFFSIYVRRCSPSSDDSNPNISPSSARRHRPAQGLDQAAVDSLPIVTYNAKLGKQESDCVVCLSRFEDNEALRLLPNCKHCFHPECIDMWLYSHTTCPLCRRNLLDKGSKIVSAPTVNPGNEETGSGEALAVADTSNAELVRETEHGNLLEVPMRTENWSGMQVGERGQDSPIHGVMSASPSPLDLRRSHSFGHELGDTNHPIAESSVDLDPPLSRFPLLSPTTSSAARLPRSRSYTLLSLSGVHPQLQGSSQMAERSQVTPSREWRFSLKRIYSLRSSTPQQAVTVTVMSNASDSSGGRRTFERLGV